MSSLTFRGTLLTGSKPRGKTRTEQSAGRETVVISQRRRPSGSQTRWLRRMRIFWQNVTMLSFEPITVQCSFRHESRPSLGDQPQIQSAMPINILIAESAISTAESIRGHLARLGNSIAVAQDAAHAWRLMSVVLPDIVLVNWILRSESGATLSNQMRANSNTKHVPIVMLGPRRNRRRSIDALYEELAVDVDGYVANPTQHEEISAAVGAALRQRQIPRLTDEPVSIGGLSLHPASRRVFADQSGTQIVLSVGPTELRLLYFFMTHPGRVYTKVELLDEVWGDRTKISERTISTYVKRLRTALKPADRAWMIEAVRTFGYRFAS